MNLAKEINNNYFNLSEDGFKKRQSMFNSFYEFFKAFCKENNIPNYDSQYYRIIIKNVIEFFVSSMEPKYASQNYNHNDISKLVVNAPPRHGKSLITSIIFPIWALTLFPHLKFIIFSETKALASSFINGCKNFLSSKFISNKFSGFLSRIKKNNKTLLTTHEGGQIYASSLRCGAIGFGADFIIVDDPHNHNDAFRPNRLKMTHNWFTTSIITRLNKHSSRKSGIIMSMQRIHFNDLTSHAEQNKNWNKLELQLKSENNKQYPLFDEIISYEEGDILNKNFCEEEIENMRTLLGEGIFRAQYQQQPRDIGVTYFKEYMFKYYDDSTNDCHSALSTCHPALDAEHNVILHSMQDPYKPEKILDSTSLLQDDTQHYHPALDAQSLQPLSNVNIFNSKLMEAKRPLTEATPRVGGYTNAGLGSFDNNSINNHHSTPPDNEGMIVQSWDMASTHNSGDYSVCTVWKIIDNKFYLIDLKRVKYRYQELKALVYSQYEKHGGILLIEEYGSGIGILDELKNDEKMISVYSIKPNKSKEIRVQNILHFFDRGCVLLPKKNNTKWLHDFEDELLNFPHLQHDDQVDSVTQFLEWRKKNSHIKENNIGPKISWL